MANADRCVCCGEIIPEGTMACPNCLVVSKKQDKRLIDANALIAEYDRVHIGEPGKARKLMEDAPTVDAVEVVRYKELVEKYHELRENFIDYVCSGIRNEAPYCLNKCELCVDKRGWCKLERCQGFNPAEVIVDGERKDNGSNI